MGEARYLVVTPDFSGDAAAVFCVRAMTDLVIALDGKCELSQIRVEVAEEGGP